MSKNSSKLILYKNRLNLSVLSKSINYNFRYRELSIRNYSTKKNNSSISKKKKFKLLRPLFTFLAFLNKKIFFINMYIQTLLSKIYGNKYFPLYYIAFFILLRMLKLSDIFLNYCIEFANEYFCMDSLDYLYSDYKQLRSQYLYRNLGIKFNLSESSNNIDKNLNNLSSENLNNTNENLDNISESSLKPFLTWLTEIILCNNKDYYPSQFQDSSLPLKSSILNFIPKDIFNIDTNEGQKGIKGKVTLTELKTIQEIEQNIPIISLQEQYDRVEKQLQGFIDEREKKMLIIERINKGIEEWYPLSSKDQMDKTITQIIDPAIKNLLEMRDNLIKEIQSKP
jgi:hypothetical protein